VDVTIVIYLLEWDLWIDIWLWCCIYMGCHCCMYICWGWYIYIWIVLDGFWVHIWAVIDVFLLWNL